jgi:hypothetical protein
MPLTDNATIIPGTGHVLTGVVGTAVKPTLAALETFAADTSVPPAGFLDLGHTALDNVLTFGQDGGDSETKGTWQNPSLREVLTSQIIDSIVVPALQIKDNDVLRMYYGGGDDTVANEFSVPDISVPQERVLLVVMVDGEGVLGLYASKVSIRRDDAIAVDTTDFLTLPLRLTFLKVTGKPKMTWIAEGLGTVTP